MSDMVQLNVGGTVFATSRATLTVHEDSMLGNMFNGTWKLTTDPEGRYFIDRDGSLFRHVLNFLRTGRLLIPDEFPELQLLRCEADFYQIGPLVEAVDRENQRREQLTKCNQDYYLLIAQINTFGQDCQKILALAAHLEVLESLPLDTAVLQNMFRTKDSTKGYSYNNFRDCRTQCYTDGELYQIITTYYRRSVDSIRMNKSYLAGILLAKNCSLVSSSFAFHDNETDGRYELHCSEKWRIPVESLQLLSEVPKLL